MLPSINKQGGEIWTFDEYIQSSSTDFSEMHKDGGKQSKAATTWGTQPQLPTNRQIEHSEYSTLSLLLFKSCLLFQNVSVYFNIRYKLISFKFFITRVVTFS